MWQPRGFVPTCFARESGCGALLMMCVCALLGGCSADHPSGPRGDTASETPARVAAGQSKEPRGSEAPGLADPVAVINGKALSREALIKPLVQAYGLNVLLQIIQMDLARQDAAKAGVIVTPADVQTERATMLKGFFPDADPSDYEQLLDQLLKQQNVTRPQFEIVLETNAYLRKMAEPM